MSTPTNPFADLMARLNLDDTGAAAYLGVPVFTFRKWAAGERKPSASAIRLLDVLGTVEALAPALHAGFLPAHVDKVRVKPKRHVKKVPANSVMSKNPV